MKRVLIITYYWPPSGGSGVQRWLKMSKYLPEFGWQPVIYTAKDAEYPVEDCSLEKDVNPDTEVLRNKIIEPYNLYKKFLGIKHEHKVKAGFISENESPSWKTNLSVWLRGNLFIPDARCLWIKPSVRFLKKYLKENPVDAIISTGPPHSMHIIAMKLHKKTHIPWIADFRDPWTDIDFYKELKLTKASDRKHHRLEKRVLTSADKVVTVGNEMAKSFHYILKRDIDVITNGYDIEKSVSRPDCKLSEKFTITHVGIIPQSRNHLSLWTALSELIIDNTEIANKLEIKLIGSVDNSVREAIKFFGLEKNTTFIDNIPHDEVTKQQFSSQILLLLINDTPNAKSILTGKIYEYLYACRPILAIGPEDGDAADIINKTNAGYIIDFKNKDKIKQTVLELFNLYKQETLRSRDNGAELKFTREELAKEYSILLNDTIAKR